MKRFAFISAVLVAGQLVAGQAFALAPLASVSKINTGLRDLMIADQLRIACPTLSARMIKGWSFARSLESDARAMGYSKEEIADFVESKADRRRIEGNAAAYMKANGVISGQTETYCALGREEIAKASQIGALLRAK
jgi:hypothetical protein